MHQLVEEVHAEGGEGGVEVLGEGRELEEARQVEEEGEGEGGEEVEGGEAGDAPLGHPRPVRQRAAHRLPEEVSRWKGGAEGGKRTRKVEERGGGGAPGGAPRRG